MGNYASYPSLDGRTVFITGGASGIGESLVEAFARQKSQVAFVDIDTSTAKLLQTRLEDKGLLRPWFWECDVRDIPALESCLRQSASEL